MNSLSQDVKIPYDVMGGGGSGPCTMLARWRRHNLLQVVTIVLVLGVFLIAINVYQLRMMQVSHLALHGIAEVEGDPAMMLEAKPKVWVAAKRIESGYLDHVLKVFHRIGYIRNGGGEDGVDWDVLWAHDYPFGKTFSKYLTHLKPHQRVNHWPGSGYFTNKLNLATSKIKHVPRAFNIPKQKEEFLNYTKDHPDLMWVQKSNSHRGIKIKSLQDLKFDATDTFIQEYIGDPYLVDGHRFDIGLYTALTSINPLRAYVFNNEWLIRFCPEEYHPFDPEKILKYVITDDYKPVWEVPKMAKYYTDGEVTRKQALMDVLEEEGRDGKKLEQDLFDTVVSVFRNKESKIQSLVEKYPSSRNFFELVRFDFVLDKDLNVYLMEVNMSPNLSSGHFGGNKLMYEQVLYSLFNLVGVARSSGTDFDRSNSDEAGMQVSSKDIQVYSYQCAGNFCKGNCKNKMCQLCHQCLKSEDELKLKDAFREHMNRHGFQRVFPQTFQTQEEAQSWKYKTDENFKSMNAANQMITLWFRGKCIQDHRWCS